MPKTFYQKHHGGSFAGNPSRTAVRSDLRSVQNKQTHVALALIRPVWRTHWVPSALRGTSGTNSEYSHLCP